MSVDNLGDIVVVRFPGHAMNGRIGTVEPCRRADDVHVRIDGALWCFGRHHVASAQPADRARSLLKGTTPGPWRVVYGTDVTHLQVPDVEVSDADEWRIAACETPESPGGCARNAALIAAAPDLARDLIAEAEAHEVTRRDLEGTRNLLAKASDQGMEVQRLMAEVGIVLDLGDDVCSGAMRRAVEMIRRLERERDEARARRAG